MFWLAVLKLDLTVDEALTGMTLNAACSLDLGDEIGTIEEGKRADLVVLEGSSLDELAYHFGIHPVRAVVKDGALVYRKTDGEGGRT
jgi:imidazolonepropionase